MSAASFVLLRAGALRLLVPQAQVGAAESIDGAPAPTGADGWFEDRQGRRLAALSAAMRPLAEFPRDRFVITRLRVDAADVGLAWDEVRVLIDVPLQRQPLPAAMRGDDGPIDAFVEHEGEVLLCTTAQRLLAYAQAAGAVT